jgi:hypothetical protein
VSYAPGWPLIARGLRVRGLRAKGVFLGERGVGKRWRVFVMLDREHHRLVVNDSVLNAKITPHTPRPRDKSRPPTTYFRLTADEDNQPGLLIRINTWSPDGGRGDWPDINPPGTMPCGYGAYDEAGLETYKDGFVEIHDDDELAISVGPQVDVLRVARGRLFVHPRSGG